MNKNPEPTDAIINIRDLRYGITDQLLFDGIDITVPRGKITSIMGPSGSGKTTLLRLITGQMRPFTGQVTIDGVDVHRLRRKDLFALRMRMGVLFQHSALFPDLNVFENVAFPLREHTRLPEAILRNIVLMKLHAVGLRGARELMPAELSGGMTRRVALARAVVMDPDIILYDDPFSGQDPVTLGVLMQLIRQLTDSLGVTSIVVSHDVEEVIAISDYCYFTSNRKIADHGTPQRLNSSGNDAVRQFINAQPQGPVAFDYPSASMAEDLFAKS